MSKSTKSLFVGDLDQAIDRLASTGWYCGQSVIQAQFIHELNQFIDQEDIQRHFKPAAIGKGVNVQNKVDVRGDRTLWVDEKINHEVILRLNQMIERVREAINRQLFAAIVDFEGHFAIYPPGTFYRRHVDTFRHDDCRMITFILYLNDNWREKDGGHLRLYTSETDFVDIEPRSGNLVLFQSRNFEHEVLPAYADRRSFTGWYRVAPFPKR